jgi:hypothetical protein
MAAQSSFRWLAGSLVGRNFPFMTLLWTLSGRFLCILTPERSGGHTRPVFLMKRRRIVWEKTARVAQAAEVEVRAASH